MQEMTVRRKLVAHSRFLHEGQMQHIGAKFEADDQDAEDLIAMGFASEDRHPLKSAAAAVARAVTPQRKK